MEAPEIIEVENAVQRCDGGDDPLGHPAVYLNLGLESQVDCPYCGRRFVRGEGAPKSAH